ncbi:MAG: glycerophosphodiester phosphodiesterase, partial [Proteobacteria bacterium]|nr:glycerophosphodiester phosphodiesterase [Pseudomonadota bacterium]
SVVSSFDYDLLKRLHAAGVRLPMLLLVSLSRRRTPAQFLRNASLALVPQLLPRFLSGAAIHYSLAHKIMISAMQRRGGTVFVWTVDNVELMKKFISLGVDGIITNDPDKLLNILSKHP